MLPTTHPGRVLYKNFYFKTMLFNYITVCQLQKQFVYPENERCADIQRNVSRSKRIVVVINYASLEEFFLIFTLNNNLFLYYSTMTYSITRHFAIHVRYTLKHHPIIYEDELSATIISTTIPMNIGRRRILLIHCCS